MSETTKNPEDEQVHDTTTVDQIDVNIDELFGIPGAANIMLPSEEEKSKNVFSKESTPDTSFLDIKPSTSKERRGKRKKQKLKKQ